MIALTHRPSPHMAACQRTYVPQAASDLELAERQHAAYCTALSACSADVRTLDVNGDFPDSTFIEDTAIVLDEVAILCPMGTASRRAEPARIEPVLRKYREVVRIELPATLEGGDVLCAGRKLLVGQSSRTNAAGIAALAAIVGRYGYDIRAVPVHACLHLKTACTALPDGRLLVNSAWINIAALQSRELVHIPATEPWGANVALVGNTVLSAAAHVQTAELIRRLGFTVNPVELSEFAKAEGGVTCLSLLFS
jgi:dimethylargininase